MIRLKTLRSHQICTLFKLQHPSLFNLLNLKSQCETPLIPSLHTKAFILNSIFNRNISLSAQFKHEFATQEAKEKSKKPLEALFTEAVGLSKSEIEDNENENDELKKSLRKLEVELRRNGADSKKELKPLSGTLSKSLETFFTEAVGLSVKGHESDIDQIENGKQELKRGLKTLSGLFTTTVQRERSKKEPKKMEESMDFKELSPDMAMFANYLHRKGYLMNANFLPNNKFDVSCFENNYGRDFLKFAAENFAKDHRDISKWLPDNDLKKVAQFGCPSLGRKTVFSAKSVRLFYGIREETVCNRCMLKESCKFANQSVWKKGAKNMDLTVVMRVITSYALEAVPPQLEVPDDVKNAINRLLKEVVRLSGLES